MSDIIRVDEGLLHEVKEYCRIDELDWEESTMILALVESAISDLAIAGVNMPKYGTLFYAQYKLLLFHQHLLFLIILVANNSHLLLF